MSKLSNSHAAPALFKRAFGHAPPRVLRVPASLELLGGQTEPHGGLVFAAAIDRFVEAGFVPRTDGRVEVVGGVDRRAKFWLSECEPGRVPGWAMPVVAVVRRLRELGAPMRGFNLALASGIPAGIGLGESAAETLAVALAIREMFPFSLGETGLGRAPKPDEHGRLPAPDRRERMRLAGLCAEAAAGCRIGEELAHPFVTALAAREGWLVQTDCLHWTAEAQPFEGGIVPVICDSGVRERNAGLRASQLATLGGAAARVMGLKCLRSLAPAQLRAERSRLGAREYGAARFVMEENHRVVAVEQALRHGELGELGRQLRESHRAAQQYGGITCPELDLMVELAAAHPACLGARYFGAGFGGAVVSLVAGTRVTAFVKTMKSGYLRATGRDLECLPVKLVGAPRLDGFPAGSSTVR